MKRLISLVLVLALLLVGNVSFAEDFTVHAGVAFGDNRETIMKKETLTLEENKIPSEDSSDNYLRYNGKVAGYDDTLVQYYLNDSDELVDVLYNFGSASSKDSEVSKYNTIYAGLKRNYGEPLNNYGGDINIITGKAWDNAAFSIALYQLLGYGGDTFDYDEWIVECDDYNVKVDLVGYYTYGSSYNYSYHLVLSYHIFTDADMLGAVIDKQMQNDAIDSDL